MFPNVKNSLKFYFCMSVVKHFYSANSVENINKINMSSDVMSIKVNSNLLVWDLRRPRETFYPTLGTFPPFKETVSNRPCWSPFDPDRYVELPRILLKGERSPKWDTTFCRGVCRCRAAVSGSIPGRVEILIKRFLPVARRDGVAEPQSLVFLPNIPGLNHIMWRNLYCR